MAVFHPLARESHVVTVEGVAQAYHVAGQGPICIAIRAVPVPIGLIFVCRSSRSR